MNPNDRHSQRGNAGPTPVLTLEHQAALRVQQEHQAKIARLVTRQQITVMLLTGAWADSVGALKGASAERDLAMVTRAYELAELIMDVGSKRP